MRNTVMDVSAYKELVSGGGRATVPCLRIETDERQIEWMYESQDIIRFVGSIEEQLT